MNISHKWARGAVYHPWNAWNTTCL